MHSTARPRASTNTSTNMPASAYMHASTPAKAMQKLEVVWQALEEAGPEWESGGSGGARGGFLSGLFGGGGGSVIKAPQGLYM